MCSSGGGSGAVMPFSGDLHFTPYPFHSTCPMKVAFPYEEASIKCWDYSWISVVSTLSVNLQHVWSAEAWENANLSGGGTTAELLLAW